MTAKARKSQEARLHLVSVSRPKQTRSERTLYRILDVAEELIQEKGVNGVSIPEIARRAGSSVGGFYARFRDKNELLRALEEQFFEELSARLSRLADAQRWARAEVPEIVAACVAELVAVARERHHLMTAFLLRGIQDPALRAGAIEFRQKVAGSLTALFLARSPAPNHPDPALAIDLAVQLAFGLIQQRAVLGETRAAGRKLGDQELQRELARVFLSYLGIPNATVAKTPEPTTTTRKSVRS